MAITGTDQTAELAATAPAFPNLDGTASQRSAPTSDPTDLSDIRVMISIFDRQGHTSSGFPKVRPADCDRLLKALKGSTDAQAPLFRTDDPILSASFANVIERLQASDVRAYPSEMLKLLLLAAQIRLEQNDHQAVREAIGHYADRPYAMEGDFKTIHKVLACDCRARAMAGDVEGLADLTLARMVFLAKWRPDRVFAIVQSFAASAALGPSRPQSDGFLDSWLAWYCRIATLATRKRGKMLSKLSVSGLTMWALLMGAGTLFLRRFGDLKPRRANKQTLRPLVTRAMGGIGDLIMMSPGLRTLSKLTGAPVRFAIPRRFFPLFENNPFVDLIDIDGPVIDISNETRWYNLSNCPAAAYEARQLPHVKKGRVELFAGGMRIRPRELAQSGWKPDIFLDENQVAFRTAFLKQKGFDGSRPIVGVQPYSRELYRDYPLMPELIGQLSRRYDIIVFHHVAGAISDSRDVATTAGLGLAQSLALVNAVDVMVSIDSGFMHAAAALNVPVVALFGPIDGQIRTAHLEKVILLQETAAFACAPCWRNEDEICSMTGTTGMSPCMASIPLQKIVAAVEKLMTEPKRLTA